MYGGLRVLFTNGPAARFGTDVWVHAELDPKTGASAFHFSGQAPPERIVRHRYGVCPANDAPL